jgi:hypothetical protein
VTAWMPDVSPILGESVRVPGMSTCVVGSSGYTVTPVFAAMLVESLRHSEPLPAIYSPDREPIAPPISA